jgi:hypothetical protein
VHVSLRLQETVNAVAPRLKLKKSPSILERHEQETYFNWLHWQRHDGYRVGDYAFAVPNGSFLHGTIAQRAIQGNALRRQGVQAGVPDAFLMIPIAPYHGLAIEFKRIGGGKPTDDQLQWHARLRKQGYRVETCYGFEAAQVATQKYLAGIEP